MVMMINMSSFYNCFNLNLYSQIQNKSKNYLHDKFELIGLSCMIMIMTVSSLTFGYIWDNLINITTMLQNC